MKFDNKIILFFIFSLSLLFFFLITISYIGYTITLVCSIALIGLIFFLIRGRNDIKRELSERINKYSLIALFVIVLFFVTFSLFFLKNTELIFFDEQIYQSIALNIINHGNALTCMFGTGYLHSCHVNGIGFDPNGWPFLIAIAFTFFGIGTATAHNLEIFFGASSIISVFLLSSLLTDKKEIPILSALIFTLIPEIFIWSKTLANPNVPFMFFATMSIFFFVLFARTRTKNTLALSLFSIVLAIYLRVEAFLLIPIFVIVFFTFSENGVKETLKNRIKSLKQKNTLSQTIPLLMIFLLLILPEVLVVISTTPELFTNASSFLSHNMGLFSLSYLPKTGYQNILFLFGGIAEYPIFFLPEITVFAILGAIALALRKEKRIKNNIGVLLLLLSLFLGYFIFYGIYFSGSALLGGSVRFLLVLYPALAILAAFGLYGLSEMPASLLRKRHRRSKQLKSVKNAICIILIILFFIVPFVYYAVPFLTHPNYSYADFPIIPNTTSQNDSYAMTYANKSLAFINSNYDLVPTTCLVFSPSPYIWYKLNRSSAYVSEYNASNQNITGYRCFILDYSWFCGNPFNNTICNAILNKYKLKVLATESGDGSSNFSLYQILNYSPT